MMHACSPSRGHLLAGGLCLLLFAGLVPAALVAQPAEPPTVTVDEDGLADGLADDLSAFDYGRNDSIVAFVFNDGRVDLPGVDLEYRLPVPPGYGPRFGQGLSELLAVPLEPDAADVCDLECFVGGADPWPNAGYVVLDHRLAPPGIPHAVPEPSALLLMLLGASLAVRRRRRCDHGM